MVSCFFCQSLLSDFIEGILPASRSEEVKAHLHACEQCEQSHTNLRRTVDLLGRAPSLPLNRETSLRITEASLSRSKHQNKRVVVSRVAMGVGALALLFGLMPLAFPQLFGWFDQVAEDDEAHFSRYYPLLQGAESLVEEQANWLSVREPLSRSVWEEGGLSPEEFEKTFQGKSEPRP